jgi:hypothetical protein
MPTTTKDVRDALYAIIAAVSSAVIASKYKYPNPAPESYPTAYPVLKETREGFAIDTQMDTVAMDFIIRIVIKDNNDEATDTLVHDAVATVLAELRKKSNNTLGGICHKFHVSASMQLYRSSQEQLDVIVCDILCTAESLVDMTL